MSVLERALRVAAAGPLGAAFRRGDSLFVAIEPVEVLVERDASVALDRFAGAVDSWRRVECPDTPTMFGWLAYDALREDEPGARTDARPSGDAAPLAWLARYSAVMQCELTTGRIELHGDDPGARGRLARAWDASTSESPATRTAWSARSQVDRRAHRASVETVREAIRAGEVYLVNVARMLHVDAGVDDASLIARIVASDARYSALIDCGEARLGGMSMELALAWRRTSGRLESRPIKGTRPRGATPAEDARLATELASDPKERAENVMAVDVHRNDLGRVAARGSVTVAELCAVESHAFVHHLVSTVRARVREDATTREVLASVLPVGSVTGAPKRSAMTMIAGLELEKRGIYTGVYGAIGGDGSLTLAVAIRTMVADTRGRVHYGSGGGIVADSNPEREWDELAWKERALSEPRRGA